MRTQPPAPSLLRVAALAASVVLATACSGPVGFFAGGALDGTPAPPPADWGFIDEVETVALETSPVDPYSVNLWITRVDDRLYVHAGASRSTWAEHLEAHPRARLEVEGKLYDVDAARVVDQEEFDAFAEAYEDKYDYEPRNGDVGEAYLFRLSPRR